MPVRHNRDMVRSGAKSDKQWVPDNPDGSGWANVDWTSSVRGSRYHYRHGPPRDEAELKRPAWYVVVTRLDTPLLHAPHENSYLRRRSSSPSSFIFARTVLS